jgi:hypothetical protein
MRDRRERIRMRDRREERGDIETIQAREEKEEKEEKEEIKDRGCRQHRIIELYPPCQAAEEGHRLTRQQLHQPTQVRPSSRLRSFHEDTAQAVHVVHLPHLLKHVPLHLLLRCPAGGPLITTGYVIEIRA